MRIPVAKPYLDGSESRAVAKVLCSGWISQGPKCAEFERALATFVDVKHGRAVNSGTNAIHLSLLACDIQPGDEVIVPAFTCVATLNPLEYIGARPVLVDVGIDTFGLDISKVAEAITPRTKAIIAVHMFGLVANIEEVMSCASRHGLKVIEDASLGLGARLGHQCVGSFGDVATLSFHPRKIITTGEGGMVLTNSHEIANRVSELRNYGASVPAWERHSKNLFDLPNYERVGYNYKFTDIQASIGLEQVKKLPAILKMRRKIAQRYDDALSDLHWLQLPQEPAGWTHAYQSYVCLLKTNNFCDLNTLRTLRLYFLEHLAKDGIASVQGAQSMPTISFYNRKYGWKPQDYPMALWADRGSVALPIYPSLTQDDQNQVIQSILSFRP
jgi:perosamine synthetase